MKKNIMGWCIIIAAVGFGLCAAVWSITSVVSEINARSAHIAQATKLDATKWRLTFITTRNGYIAVSLERETLLDDEVNVMTGIISKDHPSYYNFEGVKEGQPFFLKARQDIIKIPDHPSTFDCLNFYQAGRPIA